MKLKLLPLYGFFFSVFGLAAFSKLATVGQGTPAWFLAQFSKTPLGAISGILFYGIAALESAVFAGFAISFLRGEFLPDRARPILLLSLLGSQMLFIVLGTGLRISQDFHGAAELVIYFGVTLLAYAYVERQEQKDPAR